VANDFIAARSPVGKFSTVTSESSRVQRQRKKAKRWAVNREPGTSMLVSIKSILRMKKGQETYAPKNHYRNFWYWFIMGVRYGATLIEQKSMKVNV
jgi:hypothetical protein